MIEHCVSAFLKSQEEKAYKIYVTDVLKAFVKAPIRWIDLVEQKPKKAETRNADEIISDFKKRLNKGGET